MTTHGAYCEAVAAAREAARLSRKIVKDLRRVRIRGGPGGRAIEEDACSTEILLRVRAETRQAVTVLRAVTLERRGRRDA